MSYIKAEEILPPELINEIQKYIQGTQIYIPKKQGRRLGWGMKNGTRNMIKKRNNQIRESRKAGQRIEDLADYYNLSVDSIRKILYSRVPAAGE